MKKSAGYRKPRKDLVGCCEIAVTINTLDKSPTVKALLVENKYSPTASSFCWDCGRSSPSK